MNTKILTGTYDDLLQYVRKSIPLETARVAVIAQKAGCSTGTLYQIRSGRLSAPKVTTLASIVKAMPEPVRFTLVIESDAVAREGVAA